MYWDFPFIDGSYLWKRYGYLKQLVSKEIYDLTQKYNSYNLGMLLLYLTWIQEEFSIHEIVHLEDLQ